MQDGVNLGTLVRKIRAKKLNPECTQIDKFLEAFVAGLLKDFRILQNILKVN